MGVKERDKGARGERDFTHRIGGKRIGYAYRKTAIDCKTDFANYQVKNRTIGGSLITSCH